jgi:DNA polymerase V
MITGQSERLTLFIFSPVLRLRTALFSSPVRAGFPSPAEDYIEKTLDFNEYLVKHPVATFCLRVSGNSMIGAGIYDGDLLVVDRALAPANNRIVIAMLDGELTVKRLIRRGQRIFLTPENPDYSPIEISPESNFEIWGIVTNVIRSLR